jgi:FSR family fosmidomycin resistance protein-like MFS transporter
VVPGLSSTHTIDEQRLPGQLRKADYRRPRAILDASFGRRTNMFAIARARDPSFRRDAHVIGLVGFAHGTSHFFHLIVAPLFPWLKVEFGLSYAQLGMLVSVFFVISGAGQAAAGFVVDRVGALPVLLTGVALSGVAALVLASSQSYPILILGAGIAGLGNSVFHPADFTLLNKRVSASRLAYAYSVHGLAGTLGWAAAPVFLAGLATTIGWRGALVGAAVLAFGVLATLIVNRGALGAGERLSAAHADAKHKSSSVGFLRLPAVWMCFAFFFITAMAIGGVQSFMPAALVELYAVPLSLATMSITLFMLSYAGGMLLGGFLAAKSRHHERIIAAAFLLMAAMSILLATGAIAAPLIVVVISTMGLGAGIAGPSRDLLVRAAAPRNATGRVYGVVYSGLDVGLSISPLVFGSMMDSHHPGWVFATIGLFQALALVTAVGVGQNTAARLRQPV